MKQVDDNCYRKRKMLSKIGHKSGYTSKGTPNINIMSQRHGLFNAIVDPFQEGDAHSPSTNLPGFCGLNRPKDLDCWG